MGMGGGAVLSINPTAAIAVGGASVKGTVQMSGSMSLNTRPEVEFNVKTGKIVGIVGQESSNGSKKNSNKASGNIKKRNKKRISNKKKSSLTKNQKRAKAAHERRSTEQAKKRAKAAHDIDARNSEVGSGDNDLLHITNFQGEFCTKLTDITLQNTDITLIKEEYLVIFISFNYERFSQERESNPYISPLMFVSVNKVELYSNGTSTIIDVVFNAQDPNSDNVSEGIYIFSSMHSNGYTSGIRNDAFGISEPDDVGSETYSYRAPIELAANATCEAEVVSSTDSTEQFGSPSSFSPPPPSLTSLVIPSPNGISSDSMEAIITSSTFAEAKSVMEDPNSVNTASPSPTEKPSGGSNKNTYILAALATIPCGLLVLIFFVCLYFLYIFIKPHRNRPFIGDQIVYTAGNEDENAVKLVETSPFPHLPRQNEYENTAELVGASPLPHSPRQNKYENIAELIGASQLPHSPEQSEARDQVKQTVEDNPSQSLSIHNLQDSPVFPLREGDLREGVEIETGGKRMKIRYFEIESQAQSI